MFFIYDTSGTGRNDFRSSKPISEWNPLPPYLRHYENLLYLKFMQDRGDPAEKRQATKELVICERKLAFWSRHPKWKASEAASEVLKLKSKWKWK